MYNYPSTVLRYSFEVLLLYSSIFTSMSTHYISEANFVLLTHYINLITLVTNHFVDVFIINLQIKIKL